MAGMLPGVESARRRRIHGGSGAADPASCCSRRSSFCLYATGHDQMHLSSASSASTSSCTSMKRSILNKEIHDGTLGNVAREAKQRLDAKLMAIGRHNSTGRMKTQQKNESRGGQEQQQQQQTVMMLGNVQREVFSSKMSLKKFSWSKLGWKASEQAECVVCLEEFKAGEVLVHLPCAHRFHWNCAAPWLESRSQCPCCRTSIFSK